MLKKQAHGNLRGFRENNFLGHRFSSGFGLVNMFSHLKQTPHSKSTLKPICLTNEYINPC